MIFSAICPTNSIEEKVIVIPGQRYLPLNDHQSTTTFTNTLFHNDSSHRVLVRARHRTRTTIVRVFAFLPSVDFRLLESRITITIVRIDTIEARSAHSACAHTAIVNIAAPVYGEILIDSTVQPSLSSLLVLTGTHRCDDPPRQGGGSPERQLVRCVDCGRALLVHSERGRHSHTHSLG